MNQQFTYEFMSISNLYLMNILDFKLSQLGIEEIDFEIDKNAFAA